jgi:hypothetical protein
MGNRCGIGGIETGDDGLWRVGSDAALRMGDGLQAELGDKQRDGNGRAPQQELFHSCFLQFGETELTSKIP